MREAVIYDGLTPRLYQTSDQFPGVLPPLSTEFRKLSPHGYVGRKIMDVNRRYRGSINSVEDEFDRFCDTLTRVVHDFRPLLTDFDLEEVLPSTCALGIHKPAHTDLEALGYLGVDNDFEYSDDVIDAVVNFYKMYVPAKVDRSLSLPRGKNIGYPFPISGGQRLVNDIFLGASAALSIGMDKAGLTTLQDLYSFLEIYHGPCFTPQGERYQHTAKVQPIGLTDALISSNNFEPRVRIINMSPKVSVARMRSQIKRFLSCLLATPVHTQDRGGISDAIKMMGRFTSVFAVDFSKFDFRAGGLRGKQMCKVLGAVLGDQRFYDDLITDFNTPLYAYAHRNAYIGRGDLMLKSGMGSTTLIGCVCNLVTAVSVVSDVLGLSPSQALAQLNQSWSLLSWGDDTVLGFRSLKISQDELREAYAKYHMDVDFEPTIKYLGSNYLQGDFEGTFRPGYSIGRAIQQQFFPERQKDYPFSTVGYIARLELIGAAARDFHNLMKNHWNVELLGPYFDFAETKTVLRSLLPEVQKRSDKIAQLDDVLNLFTHGIYDTDSSLVDIDDDYLSLLGDAGFAKLDDPAEFLIDNSVPVSVVQLVGKIQNGDFQQYQNLLFTVQRELNLSWVKGSVVY